MTPCANAIVHPRSTDYVHDLTINVHDLEVCSNYAIALLSLSEYFFSSVLREFISSNILLVHLLSSQ